MSSPSPITIPQSSPSILSTAVLPHLEPESPSDTRPLVIMMCGCAGSGKSSLAKEFCSLELTRNDGYGVSGFTRVSIDQLIYEKHGMYGRDYQPEKYEEISNSVEGEFVERVGELMGELSFGSTQVGRRKGVVLDRAFYSKDDRLRWKSWIEGELGGRVKLIWFDVEEEELWRRIVKRRERLDERRARAMEAVGKEFGEHENGLGVEEADGARDISREMLRAWVEGFERPEREGEIVVRRME